MRSFLICWQEQVRSLRIHDIPMEPFFNKYRKTLKKYVSNVEFMSNLPWIFFPIRAGVFVLLDTDFSFLSTLIEFHFFTKSELVSPYT
jgi:hypothetical protein